MANIRLFLVASVLMLGAVNIFAQDIDFRDKLSLGFKAGINYANVWDEKGSEFTADSKVGFAVGAFLAIPVGTYLGFQPEVLISQKGFEGNGRILGSDYSFSRTTTYIDVPLQAQFKPSEFLTILAGPTYSYLINQNDSFTFNNNIIGQDQAFENEDLRDNLLGFSVGADLNFNHLVLSGRLAWDLTQNSSVGSSEAPRYRNRWAQVTVGYRF